MGTFFYACQASGPLYHLPHYWYSKLFFWAHVDVLLPAYCSNTHTVLSPIKVSANPKICSFYAFTFRIFDYWPNKIPTVPIHFQDLDC